MAGYSETREAAQIQTAERMKIQPNAPLPIRARGPAHKHKKHTDPYRFLSAVSVCFFFPALYSVKQIASISSRTSFGSLATSTQEREGHGVGKNFE